MNAVPSTRRLIAAPNGATDVSPGVGKADLFDTGLVKLWRGYARRSVLRHPIRAILTFVLLFGASAFFALSSTKVYLVTTNLTAKLDVVSAVANPNRSQTLANVKPILNAEALITADDNLKKLMVQAKLVERYNRNEPKLARWKRKLFLGKDPDPKAREDEVLRLLRGGVSAKADQTSDSVTISVLWNDAVQARDIAVAAQKNFLNDRRDAEVQPIKDALRLIDEKRTIAVQNVETLRMQLGIPADSREPLPESSPLKDALAQQQTLSNRKLDAELELASTETGFKYRYSEVRPPEVPLAPVKGSLKLILLGLILAGGAAVAVAVAADTRKGAIIEPWQVTRKLNLPVLAELKRP